MTTKFVIDGQEYESVEQMPPEVRKQYEQLMNALDQDKNGVPDLLEHGGFLGKMAHKFIIKNVIAKSGQFQDLSKLPPELRKLFDPEGSGIEAGSEPSGGTSRRVVVEDHNANRFGQAPMPTDTGGLEGLSFTRFLYILLALVLCWVVLSRFL